MFVRSVVDIYELINCNLHRICITIHFNGYWCIFLEFISAREGSLSYCAVAGITSHAKVV